MNCDPTDTAPPFNLANLFWATGRKIEAAAALRAATRTDPTFAEARYNLSNLLARIIHGGVDFLEVSGD
jgi:Tetratricopeptide repeat